MPAPTPDSYARFLKRFRRRKQRSDEWRARERARALAEQVERDERGRPTCRAHQKRWYADDEAAHRARIEGTRSGALDPGAEIFWCNESQGFHLRHPDGWRSLERLIEEHERDRPDDPSTDPFDPTSGAGPLRAEG